MRIWMTAMAMAAALAAGAPARAQAAVTSGPDAAALDEVAALVDQLSATLSELADGLDVDVPDLGPLFRPLFETALPELPDEDGESSFAIGFNFTTTVTDAATLEREDDWMPVYADAQSCAAVRPGMAVVHFERLPVEGGAGHHCVAVGPGEEDADAWLLVATWVIETPQRRLESRVGAAAATGADGASGTYAAAAAIGDPQIPALIALSTRLGETATDMLMSAPLSPSDD